MNCDQQPLLNALKKHTDLGYKRILTSNDPSLIDLCSNDYLGFAKSAKLRNDIQKNYIDLTASSNFNSYQGSTGSRLLTGNQAFIEEIERNIAHFHNAEACLIFNSGYLANIGLLGSIADEKDVLILDTKVHASMWEGAKLSSSQLLLFKHNDIEHLEKQLKKAQEKFNQIFVCTQSLFSIKGTKAPLVEIVNLTKKYHANLIVDEAHATGVCGLKGEGLVVELGLENSVFARINTFSKALGSHGAAILGSNLLREFLINFSKPFIYSTALSTYNYISIMTAYEKLQFKLFERERLNELIEYLKTKILKLELPITPTSSHIQPIEFTSMSEAVKMSSYLKSLGIDIRCIRPPTVRRDETCLRVSLHAFNSTSDIDLLLQHCLLNQKKIKTP